MIKSAPFEVADTGDVVAGHVVEAETRQATSQAEPPWSTNCHRNTNDENFLILMNSSEWNIS